MEDDCSRNSSSCLDFKNATVMEIFGSLVPSCGITTLWTVAFYFHTFLFSVLFLLAGVACLVFLSKRHIAQRFKTRTFIAIDIALAILGFSKLLFYIIDPYGIAGYCTHLACVVVSRLLFAVGFPSLTAAYTLVFLTLWYSAKMRLGRACIQKWRIIIPLCFIHYLVAIVFELVGIFGQSYYIVFLLIGCEVFFTVWGFLVCATFLIGGIRLLQTVSTSARESSIVARDAITHNYTRKDGTTKVYQRSTSTMKLRRKKHQKQAIRKVGIITYSAAAFGALYSLLGIVQLVMVCFQLFGECSDEEASMVTQNNSIWLALKYIGGAIEVLLTVLLIYSINDVKPVVIFIRDTVRYVVHCGRVSDNGSDSESKKQNLFRYNYSMDSTTKGSSRSSSPVHGDDTPSKSNPSVSSLATKSKKRNGVETSRHASTSPERETAAREKTASPASEDSERGTPQSETKVDSSLSTAVANGRPMHQTEETQLT